MKLISFFSNIAILIGSATSLTAAAPSADGRYAQRDEKAKSSAQEHFSTLMRAHENKNWKQLIDEASLLMTTFPSSPFAQEALFYLGVGYFHFNDFEIANQHFSNYLKKQATPKHFEEAIEFKFSIAEKYQEGAKKHIMGWGIMPQWVPAQEDAIAIYDEVITALPHHELGAKALFGKAKLLMQDEDYKASIETFQTLIRRFPKSPLAPESYIGIAGIYLMQCQTQYPDLDFLDLAEINLRKFHQDFPGEKRIGVAEQMLLDMKEFYAENLYETAQFYERTKKHQASLIYYSNLLAKYPETKIALKAQKRFNELKKEGGKKEKPNNVISSCEEANPPIPGSRAAPRPNQDTQKGDEAPAPSAQDQSTSPSMEKPFLPESGCSVPAQ